MPVMLPPGCAKESASPSATKSSLTAMSGMVRVAARRARSGSSGPATIASGAALTKSAAKFGEFLVAKTKTTREDFEVVVFDKAMDTQLTKERSNGGPFSRRRDQKTDTVNATRFLTVCPERKGSAAKPHQKRPASNMDSHPILGRRSLNKVDERSMPIAASSVIVLKNGAVHRQRLKGLLRVTCDRILVAAHVAHTPDCVTIQYRTTR